MPIRTASILAVLALLGACAGDVTGYPSLAPRKIEKDIREEPAPPVEPTIVAPAGTSPALAKIVEDAGTADAAFQAALAKSRGRIESGNRAAAGSEGWIAEQPAYSSLDVLRGPVVQALADLDRQRQQAVSKGEDESAIAAVLLQVQAIDEAERAALARLSPSN